MKILLTGASGFIGRHLTRKLQSNGHTVIACSRKNGFDFTKMRSKENWMPHLNHVDIIINCVGIIYETREQTFNALHYQTPSALFQAGVDANVKRIIQISALGADEHSSAPYHITKKAADDVLRSLPVNWFILRPSLVYGHGGKSTAFFKRLARFPVILLMEGGLQPVQPVHINDLTDCILRCLVSTDTNITIDVVGAHALFFKDWLQLIRTSENRPEAHIISIPFKFCLIIAWLLKPFIPLMQTENIRMLRRGNFSDVTPLAEFLGHLPVDITTGWSKL